MHLAGFHVASVDDYDVSKGAVANPPLLAVQQPATLHLHGMEGHDNQKRDDATNQNAQDLPTSNRIMPSATTCMRAPRRVYSTLLLCADKRRCGVKYQTPDFSGC